MTELALLNVQASLLSSWTSSLICYEVNDANSRLETLLFQVSDILNGELIDLIKSLDSDETFSVVNSDYLSYSLIFQERSAKT
jgi:hypothetical protein